MQATPSNTAKNPCQQSPQATQEDNPSQNREQANHSNLNTSVKNNSTKHNDNHDDNIQPGSRDSAEFFAIHNRI